MSFSPSYCENIPYHYTKIHKEFHPALRVTVDNVKDQSKYFWGALSENPSAVFLLEKYPEKINWSNLSANPNAIELLEKNVDKIDFDRLSINPNAAHILRRNLEKISWTILSTNPGAISILKENQHKIQWRYLSKNPAAFDLLCDNLDKVEWSVLSANPCAVPILRAHLDKVNWGQLCQNPSVDAMDLLEEHQEKIDWFLLSSNPYGVRYLLQNPGRINRRQMQGNPAALDYFPYVFEEAPNEICFGTVTDNPRLGELLHYYPFDDMNLYYDSDALESVATHPGIFTVVSVEYDYKGILDAFYERNQAFHAWAAHPSRTLKWKDWQLEGWEMFEASASD